MRTEPPDADRWRSYAAQSHYYLQATGLPQTMLIDIDRCTTSAHDRMRSQLETLGREEGDDRETQEDR